MAKKIFILITCLFIGLTIVFYTNYANIFTEGMTKEKPTTTSISTESTSSKEKEPELPGDPEEWDLLLVNEANEIKEEPKNLQDLPNGYKIDSRIYEPFMELTEAASKAGHELTVISAYRSVAEQEALMATDIQGYQNQGYSKEEATEQAMKYLTAPGLSEHHTGLAVDVLSVDWYNQGNSLEAAFGETDAGKWLAENAARFGFVIRYEKGKEKITGINYEPWHLRYVGKENAEYMTKNQLVLEEYIDQLKK